MTGTGTRDAILGAAVELGSLRGLEDLSLGGLAAAVEMSKSGLFAHFGSKEELQLATVERAWAIFQGQVLDAPADQPWGGLQALIDRWLSFYERRVFAGGCFFVISAVEFAGRQGPVREALASAVYDQIEALESAILGARERRELAVRRDSGQLAFELHSTLVQADALFHVREDPAVFVRARRTIDELLSDAKKRR